MQPTPARSPTGRVPPAAVSRPGARTLCPARTAARIRHGRATQSAGETDTHSDWLRATMTRTASCGASTSSCRASCESQSPKIRTWYLHVRRRTACTRSLRCESVPGAACTGTAGRRRAGVAAANFRPQRATRTCYRVNTTYRSREHHRRRRRTSHEPRELHSRRTARRKEDSEPSDEGDREEVLRRGGTPERGLGRRTRSPGTRAGYISSAATVTACERQPTESGRSRCACASRGTPQGGLTSVFGSSGLPCAV